MSNRVKSSSDISQKKNVSFIVSQYFNNDPNIVFYFFYLPQDSTQVRGDICIHNNYN